MDTSSQPVLVLGIDTGGTYTDGVLLEYGSRRVVATQKSLTTKRDFSIGIELEGTDHTPFTEPQYASLARLTSEIMTQYPAITAARLTGHSDIAPGRKTDPGPAFDWARFREDLGSLST